MKEESRSRVWETVFGTRSKRGGFSVLRTAQLRRVPGAHAGSIVSVRGVTLDGMEVSAETLAKVPGENLRVSRAEFGAVWALAQRLASQPGPDDPYLIGVLRTCQWLAGQPVWVSFLKLWEMPAAPLSQRVYAAMPETIDEEYLAAATAAAYERERARGVMATLEWTWHGSGRPPLDMSSAAAG